jgi:hypothetical protein
MSATRALRSLAIGALGAVMMALPRVSQACAVCMGGREDESRLAFILTTALLTFLPLTMLGVAVWLFARRALAREQEDAAALDGAGSLDRPAAQRIASSAQ